MKLYLNQNVLDAALDRIRWLYDEFEIVVCNISGGKDSTICLNLTLQVAEERNRLPLKVMFIDQEAEWNSVIEHLRDIFADPRIEPYWLQVPIKIFNATSHLDQWLNCWEIGKEDQWMREKEDIAIKENIYGTDRFGVMFEKFFQVQFPNQKACYIAGMRAQESPTRYYALTGGHTYKGVTWGRVETAKMEQYAFYPIYDWETNDVWKTIHNKKWDYCKLYDVYYQYGVPIKNMRVSNVHHETAIASMLWLQEIEGDTWEKLTQRISGINTAGQMAKNFYCPSKVPFMFKDWREYRDYLLEHLIVDKENAEKFRKSFARQEESMIPAIHEDLIKSQTSSLITNDYHGTKMASFMAANAHYSIGGKRAKRGIFHAKMKFND